MLMIKNIDLRKEKRKSTVQRFYVCVWEVGKSNSIESSLILWWICLMQNPDIISLFEMRSSSAFYRVSFWLEILSSNFNESEFSSRIRTYFRFWVSIESINKRTFFWSHSIIFFHLRFHLIQNVLNQLFCFLMFISYSLR
jgi:hypothetical protein